jgi:hypothetical protein
MLTNLQSLCLDLGITAAPAPGQPAVQLPPNLQELHTTASSICFVAWEDLTSLKHLTIEMGPQDWSRCVNLAAVPSTLEALSIICKITNEADVGFISLEGIRVMRHLQLFAWWGPPWALAMMAPQIMPTLAPALRVVELFIPEWPGLDPPHISAAHTAVVAKGLLAAWEGRPEVFKVTGIVNADTLELGPAITL